MILVSNSVSNIHFEIAFICSQKFESLEVGKGAGVGVLYPEESWSKEVSSMWHVSSLTNLNNEYATDRKF